MRVQPALLHCRQRAEHLGGQVDAEQATKVLKDLVFSLWAQGQCEDYTDTRKMLGLISFFLPYFPLRQAPPPCPAFPLDLGPAACSAGHCIPTPVAQLAVSTLGSGLVPYNTAQAGGGQRQHSHMVQLWQESQTPWHTKQVQPQLHEVVSSSMLHF